MKQEEWNEGLNHIDDALVEEHIAKKEALKKKTIWIRVGAIAASLALILGIAAVLEANYLPTWEDAQYSAEEVAGLFDGNWLAASTKAYKTVYARDIDHLKIGSAPKDTYLNVYQFVYLEQAADKTEVEALAKQFVSKVADSLGQAEPQYSIKEMNFRGEEEYSVITEMGDCRFYIDQHGRSNSISISRHKAHQIVLDGVPVQIDRRLSDEEMTDSIQTIKEKLFKLFDVSFSDVKIWRSTDTVSICFYDEDAHYLNSFEKYPVSDYIKIFFRNDAASEDILKASFINYYKNRVSADEEYPLVTKAKKISVREAEKLLYKGYTFAGHSCSLCISMNSEVSFRNYDYVGFEYKSGTLGGRTMLIPFYTFYKELYVTVDGVKTYAKTYVPAIEVSGYEEYFESQKDKYH